MYIPQGALQLNSYIPSGPCSYMYSSVEDISLWLILTGFVYILLLVFLLYFLTTRYFYVHVIPYYDHINMLMYVVIMHTF
jgi:hypothetical protein